MGETLRPENREFFNSIDQFRDGNGVESESQIPTNNLSLGYEINHGIPNSVDPRVRDSYNGESPSLIPIGAYSRINTMERSRELLEDNHQAQPIIALSKE
ncbi:hypothetical protein L484_009320 [Morus notabilis]|uniref:Uncharacterized protein n=1 Tax=Morus notabilis TaxID=981085 RepID=W9R0L6_9ROSA|nr:hypothetical protein L484_009320 [Morus notabilis]